MEAVKRSDFDLMLGKYLILIIPDAGQVPDTKLRKSTILGQFVD